MYTYTLSKYMWRNNNYIYVVNIYVVRIFIGYRLCRRPLGPEEWMPGCLDACQTSHLAFPRRREHQFEGQVGGVSRFAIGSTSLVHSPLHEPSSGAARPYQEAGIGTSSFVVSEILNRILWVGRAGWSRVVPRRPKKGAAGPMINSM